MFNDSLNHPYYINTTTYLPYLLVCLNFLGSWVLFNDYFGKKFVFTEDTPEINEDIVIIETNFSILLLKLKRDGLKLKKYEY